MLDQDSATGVVKDVSKCLDILTLEPSVIFECISFFFEMTYRHLPLLSDTRSRRQARVAVSQPVQESLKFMKC